ncbi:MAG TPA: fatty acid desaturase [Puia sp.]
MLKYPADLKTILYLLLTTAIFFVQWNIGFYWPVYIVSLYLAITVAVIAHNHNHVPMWKSSFLNNFSDNWITLLYGFPAFAWTPTHNKNHHKFNNKEGDYTITYRISERNNLFTLLTYPSISSYFQQSPVMGHLRHLYANKRNKFYLAILQYVTLGLFIGITLWLDWRKSLLYVVIPQQVALFTVMIFNYIQHVHADEESKYDHSRNFVSWFTNFMMFNNGYHTAHHNKASLHWSQLPEAHARIAHLIAPHLNQKVILVYLFKTYLIAPFGSAYKKTSSMRLLRKSREKETVLAPPTH